MAGAKEGAAGFSYAQAAMGRPSSSTPQDSTSKATSGAVTPASGAPSEVMASSSWAEEMEESMPEKVRNEQSASVKDISSVEEKSDMVEKTEATDKVPTRNSSVSSPVVVESKDGEFPSAPNGAPQGTTHEDTKAQDPKEGSWLQARADRQNAAQKAEEPTKPEKKRKESPAPKPPVVLQDAPPPSVNPWAKRLEENPPKAKVAPAEQTKKTTAPATTPKAAAPKENQRPKGEQRKKASSVSAGSSAKEAPAPAAPSKETTSENDRDTTPKAEEISVRRASSSRPAVNPWTQGPKSTSESTGAKGTPAKAALPSVKDAKSWPTPDRQPEKDQKPAVEKAMPENNNKTEEEVSSSKPRPKQQWKPMPVVPNILWETPGVGERRGRSGPNGERGGRGGGNVRGRGGGSVRGGANGANGSGRGEGATGDDEIPAGPQRGRANAGREGTAKPARAASAGALKERTNEARHDRNTRNQETRKATTAGNAAAPTTLGLTGAAEPFTGGRPAKSSKQADAPATEDVKIPEPIPRKTSVGTQTEANGSVDETPMRDVPQNSKAENRSRFEGGRDQTKESGREFAWSGQSTRGGGKRGGRGRGGSREMVNGHHANHTYANGHPADFPAPMAQFAPQIPSGRGQYQNGFSQHPRGGWRGNAARSQSIPIDGNYPNRYYQQASSMHPPMPAYGPYAQGYEYPVSAVPYEQYMDVNALTASVRQQIEYYFCLDNLLKDTFFRKQMDSQGFVLLDVPASFQRVKNLTHDINLIKAACLQSVQIEMRVGDDGKERLRCREGWEQWVLPMADRVQSAQNDGPKQLHMPQQPQLHFYGQPAVPMNGPPAYPHGDRRSYDASFAMMNGGPPSFFPGHHDGAFGGMTNGDERRPMKSPPTFEPRSAANGALMNGHPTGSEGREPDAFPNEQVEMLTVLVKSGGSQATQKAPFHSAATRTFSDGSIDSKNVFGDAGKDGDAKKEPAPTVNGEVSVNG